MPKEALRRATARPPRIPFTRTPASLSAPATLLDFLQKLEACAQDTLMVMEQMWSLKYEPDHPAAPRRPRLDQKRRWLHLDLMSVQSTALAGKAHEKFDLAVLQETFEQCTCITHHTSARVCR